MQIVAPPTNDWIVGICRQFSEATGWSLRYTSRESLGEVMGGVVFQNDTNFCWHAEINDGDYCLGFLHIDLPENDVLNRSFLPVSALAEIVAELVGRLSAADKALESRTRDVSTLVDMGRTLPNDSNLSGSIAQLMQACVQLTKFRSSAFFLLNPERNAIELRAVYGADAGEIPARQRALVDNPPDLRVLLENKCLLRRCDENDADLWLPTDASTGLCVAVASEHGPIGTLWTYDRRSRTPHQREYHVLESIAAQMAGVLERAVMLQENAAGHRLQKELEVASQSQPQNLLDHVPANVGFDSAAMCTSRGEVGGDLYELIPIDDRRIVVAIGDASGDSVPAALIMSALRGAIRSLTVDDREDLDRTDHIVQQLNRALFCITPPHQFMSLLYGIYDKVGRTFTYTNAGHPTPILVQSGEISTLNSHGLLLGITEDATYEQSTLDLDPDDVLVMFTDGISEAMSRGRQLFRSDGIVEAIEECVSGTADEILQGICAKVDSHTGGVTDDDRTLLVLKLTH
jgi:sigma-B regulation protein RsbU (phosphoserine phosphatase)